MIKTEHKYLDFSPEYLKRVDDLFRTWGWIEFLVPLVIVYGVGFGVYVALHQSVVCIGKYFNKEICGPSENVAWYGIAAGVAVLVIYWVTVYLLTVRQLPKIKDYEDIPFRSAQTAIAWSSSRTFIYAICENRPPFDQEEFSKLWGSERECIIANVLMSSYSQAVQVYLDFYFLPEDRYDIITFAPVDRRGDNGMAALDILEWTMWLDEKFKIVLFDEPALPAGTTMREIVKLCAEKTPLTNEEIKQIQR